jgi:hypothetical protein
MQTQQNAVFESWWLTWDAKEQHGWDDKSPLGRFAKKRACWESWKSMMAGEPTCEKCEHYKPALPQHEFLGSCAMHGDANSTGCLEDENRGWDRKDYVAGVYVGPMLGCNRWERKM